MVAEGMSAPYEYRKTSDLSDAEMNELGREGWQLVGVRDYHLYWMRKYDPDDHPKEVE